MSIIVLKYGGNTVATTDNLIAVAKQIVRCKAEGDDPVVVVSAMGETTDHFLTMAYQITEHPTRRELDMLLSVGERISISLLAMAINAEGPYEALSLTGSQVGIITDTNHTRAKIVEIRCARIHQVLDKNLIPIVAGYQGVSTEKEITTLGRGGSDTTAVALAAALGASQCRVMKDVDGVYSADPRRIPEAHVIEQIDYDQMLEFAATGSQVLSTSSVALAKQHRVEVAVGRADTGAIGTIITEGDFSKQEVTGLVSHGELTAIRLSRTSDLSPALNDFHADAFTIKGVLGESTRPVLLLLSESEKSPDTMLESTDWGKRAYRYKLPFARISVIGNGLEPGGKLFARLFAMLEDNQVNPRWFCCSASRVSFCVQDKSSDRILKSLHRGLVDTTDKTSV